jgi:hypothetical protein
MTSSVASTRSSSPSCRTSRPGSRPYMRHRFSSSGLGKKKTSQKPTRCRPTSGHRGEPGCMKLAFAGVEGDGYFWKKEGTSVTGTAKGRRDWITDLERGTFISLSHGRSGKHIRPHTHASGKNAKPSDRFHPPGTVAHFATLLTAHPEAWCRARLIIPFSAGAGQAFSDYGLSRGFGARRRRREGSGFASDEPCRGDSQLAVKACALSPSSATQADRQTASVCVQRRCIPSTRTLTTMQQSRTLATPPGRFEKGGKKPPEPYRPCRWMTLHATRTGGGNLEVFGIPGGENGYCGRPLSAPGSQSPANRSTKSSGARPAGSRFATRA